MDLDCHGMSACSNVPSVPFGEPSPNGIGTIDALKYLRSLDIVDPNNVGMIGMSMGGMAIDAAARAMPDAYQAMFFMDSGCLGPVCTTEKNYAISQGTGTEVPPDFGAPNGKASLSMPGAMTSFGTTEPVVPGQLYGSIADGTGKIFYEHFGDHPYSTDDPTSIGNAITWFGMTLKGGNTSMPASDQIWPIKLMGTGLAFVGFVVFLLALGGLLLRTSYFRGLAEDPPQYKGNVGGRWWGFAVFTAIVGPLTLLWSFRTAFDANYFKLEPVSTGFAGWLVVQGVITILVLSVGYYVLARPAGAGGINYGLTWETGGLDWRKIGKSALLALAVTGSAYVLLWVATAWLKVDFRFWLLTFKVTDLQHMLVMLAYVVPVAIYFVPIAIALHGTLRPRNGEASLAREVATNAVILTVGLIGLLLWFYIPLTFFGADSNLGPSALGLINAIPLIVILPVLALISTYFFRKTGHVYVGSFTNTIFIIWLLVASNTLRGF
jgi:hypothetical protein